MKEIQKLLSKQRIILFFQGLKTSTFLYPQDICCTEDAEESPKRDFC
jgi:hypothetical protein